jgi:hypothetical protein
MLVLYRCILACWFSSLSNLLIYIFLTFDQKKNTSYITLGLKIVNCITFSDYRPITFVNRIYKMILKILVNKMRDVISLCH